MINILAVKSQGNFGHAGRPGKRGGSAKRGGKAPVDKPNEVVTNPPNIENVRATTLKDLGELQGNTKSFYLLIHASDYGSVSQPQASKNNDQACKALAARLKGNKDWEDYVTKIYGGEKFTPQQFKNNSYESVNNLIRCWANTSGDHNPKAIGLQIAAAKVFGMKGNMKHMLTLEYFSKYGESQMKKRDIVAATKDVVKEWGKGYQAFVRAQYDETQKVLKEKGINELLVYRGRQSQVIDPNKKKSGVEIGVEARLQPLSSFSVNYGSAVEFSGNKGTIYSSIIPRERIFSTPVTGFGCTTEHEVVVLGGKPIKTTAVVSIYRFMLEDQRDISTRLAVEEQGLKIPKARKQKKGLIPFIIKEDKAKISFDADEPLENADWTKKTWDLPPYNSREFLDQLKFMGMTLEQFKKLPVYKARAIKKSYTDEEISSFIIEEVVKALEEDSWKDFIRSISPLEKQIKAKVVSFFKEQEKRVFKAMPANQKAMPKKITDPEFWAGEADEFTDTILPLINKVVGKEGKRVTEKLAHKLDRVLAQYEIEDTPIEDMIRNAADEINDTTFKRLVSAYDVGELEGESISEIGKRMRKVFEDAVVNRAKTIARTETVRAATEAHIQAYRQSGVVEKVQWWTAADERRCSACASMHGKSVKLGKMFSNGLEGPPLHPSCRCVTIPMVFEKYTKGEQGMDFELELVEKEEQNKVVNTPISGISIIATKMGQGNFGHAGIPGHRGGSRPKGGKKVSMATAVNIAAAKARTAIATRDIIKGKNRGDAPRDTTMLPVKFVAGKKGEKGKWVLSNGKDAKSVYPHLAHVAMPPTWLHAHINPNPNALMQAWGKSATTGRSQQVYLKAAQAENAVNKFAKVDELRKKKKAVFSENLGNMKKSKTKEEAAVVSLIFNTSIRVGDESVKAKAQKEDAFGASMLLGKHIIQKGSKVFVSFTGKKAVKQEHEVTDSALAKELVSRAKKAGSNGKIFNTKYKSVLEYTKTLDGLGFIPHNIRTLNATEKAAELIAKSKVKISTAKDYKEAVKTIVAPVAKMLGETEGSALKNYIDPRVWSSWNQAVQKVSKKK